MSTAGLILNILDGLTTAIQLGGDALTVIEQTRAEVAAMQAEGRDPTDAEWAALHERLAEQTRELDR